MKRSLIGIEKKPDENTLLLLHFDDNIVDVTGNSSIIIRKTPTYSEGVFGQCANVRLFIDNDLLSFGVNDFTIDFWYKSLNNSGYPCVLCSDIHFDIEGGFFIDQRGLILRCRLTGDDENTLTYNLSTNIWYHIAFLRRGNTLYLFINGTLVKTMSTSRSVSKSGLSIMYSWFNDANYCSGEIDELRISNIARWTSDFTPPTKPY